MGRISTHLAGAAPGRPPSSGIPWRDNRRTSLASWPCISSLPPVLLAFSPVPAQPRVSDLSPRLSPSLALAQLFARAARVFARCIGHCTRRRFSRAVSRVDARGMQPKAADVHRGRPKWATSVALAAATVISGSMHSHAQALSVHARFCTNDSAGPAHEEYDLDPAARRCIAPSR